MNARADVGQAIAAAAKIIGQAIGILMERVRASGHGYIKVRDIAQGLVNGDYGPAELGGTVRPVPPA